MKTLITILLVLFLFSCQNDNKNDSFETYIEWCEEMVTTQEAVFEVTCNVDGRSITMFKNIYPSNNSIDMVNEFLQSDSIFPVTHLEVEIIDVTAKRCEPTIQGYQNWKKDR